MKLLRISIVFLILIGLGLWGLYAQRLTLTERVLLDRISKTGCTGTELIIDAISLNSVSIASFHTSLPDGPLQQVNLKNLILQFKPGEVLNGSVEKLSIESLHLQVDPKQKVESNKSALPFATIRQYIPQDVSIKNVTVTTPDLSLNIPLQLNLKNRKNIPLAVNIGFNRDKVTFQEWQLENVKGDISLSTEDGKRITIEDSSIFQFSSVANKQTSASNCLFSFSALLQKDLETDGWQLLQSNILASTEVIRHNDITIHPSPVSFDVQGQTLPLQLHAKLHGDELSIQQKEKHFIFQEIQSTLLANEKDIDLKVQFLPEIVPVLIQTSIKHNLAKGLGTAKVSTSQPVNLQEQNDSVQKLLQSVKLPLIISDGLIKATGNIQWSDAKLQQVQASFNLRNGAGNYGKTLFNGLVIQQDLQLFPSIKTRSNGYISVSEIFNGITLSNLSLHNQLLEKADSKFPELLIESIQTELFGGIISGSQIVIDPQDPVINSQIQLNRIDLQKIVELSKVKGLNVTGILDGTIQLNVKNNVITIPNGAIHSRAPGGTINYFPPGGSAHYSTLPAYALKALEEFNYYTLAATPTYYEDGTLNIAIHMEGHSPPLETERPVHLNLNTEQNILSLLESLRYSNKITDKLEQQLQTNPPIN